MSALVLVVAVLASFSAGFIGAAFTTPAIPVWYASLRKPAWSPPSWLFGPVWSALYLSMGIAVWLIWRRQGFGGAPLAYAAFGVQLTLNAAWSVIFFGARRPMAAFVEIVCLWIAIAFTIAEFALVEPFAAALLAPYLAWVTFAAALNLSVATLNKAENPPGVT